MGQQDAFGPRQAREERLQWELCVFSPVTHCRGMADTAAMGQRSCSSWLQSWGWSTKVEKKKQQMKKKKRDPNCLCCIWLLSPI